MWYWPQIGPSSLPRTNWTSVKFGNLKVHDQIHLVPDWPNDRSPCRNKQSTQKSGDDISVGKSKENYGGAIDSEPPKPPLQLVLVTNPCLPNGMILYTKATTQTGWSTSSGNHHIYCNTKPLGRLYQRWFIYSSCLPSLAWCLTFLRPLSPLVLLGKKQSSMFCSQLQLNPWPQGQWTMGWSNQALQNGVAFKLSKEATLLF